MKLPKPVRWFARQGFLIILTAALLLEATALIQYIFARKGLEAEATRRAESELRATGLQITDVMDQVETAIRNNLWSAEAMLPLPDSLFSITEQIVRNNPVIYGSTIALEPGLFRDRVDMFSPYSYKRDGKIVTKHLGSEDYDYTRMEWYVKADEEGHWSEPYFDAGGGETLMITYSVPLHDGKGRRAGVLTADLPLDWLTELVGSVKVYPTAYSLLFSREGQIMVCPTDSLVMRKKVFDVTSSVSDSAILTRVARTILSGESGSIPVRRGDMLNYVFYAPVERTGWSMAIVVPHEEIYGDVQKVGLSIALLQLLGLALLVLILYRTARGQQRLKEAEERKKRIENELQVASGIQMSMLPKVYPPFPDRNDLDMYGSVLPAKEVGGDLYDFYIRDGRLLFCVGDVSGKGVPASLLMAVTRSLFRTVSAHENNPERIVSVINESMSETNDAEMFVTFFVAILELETGRLRYCNAGHNAPLILEPDGAVRLLPVDPNLPMGIEGKMTFLPQETVLRPQESIFLYTDGVTEAENPRQEFFGEERLIKTLRRISASAARERVERVSEAVRAFAEGAGQSDDQTLLCLRYLGHPADLSGERRLRLHNDIRQIPQLASFVETLASEASIQQPLAMQLNLALEEAVTNVIMYAYPPGTDGIVDIEAVYRPGELTFTISDNGKPFDPTTAQEVDTSLPFDQRPIGGLGIHLVRQIMDEVSYAFEDGRNVLTLKKKI